MSKRPTPGERPRAPRPLTPVVRSSLTDRVIEQLQTRIADATWPLHHRLPVEAALAADLGVGRSTIREAVRVLVHLGLLEVRQGDGTYVRSDREIDVALERRVLGAGLLEAYEVRRALEVEVARLAARRRSGADVTRLRECLQRREAAYGASGHEYRNADVALFERLADATGNPMLADLYRGIMSPLRQEIARILGDSEVALNDPDRPELSNLITAVENGDPHGAGAAAARHLDDSLLVLRLLLQEIPIPR